MNSFCVSIFFYLKMFNSTAIVYFRIKTCLPTEKKQQLVLIFLLHCQAVFHWTKIPISQKLYPPGLALFSNYLADKYSHLKCTVFGGIVTDLAINITAEIVIN